MYKPRAGTDVDNLHEVMKDWADYHFGTKNVEVQSPFIWSVRTPKETLTVRCGPAPKGDGFLIEVLGGSDYYITDRYPAG